MKYKTSVLIIFTILLFLGGMFFVPFQRMESTENRTLATFDMIFNPKTDSVVYRVSPVERLDAALSDQFPFREFLVKEYLRLFNTFDNLITKLVSKLKFKKFHLILHPIGNYYLLGDTGYIIDYPDIKTMDKNMVQKHVEQIEYLHIKYPKVRIYVYYVAQSTDTKWIESYTDVEVADHYQQIVDAIPSYIRSSHLVYNNIDDYMNLHYKTDHHWNHKGARKGYEDIYKMMSKDISLGNMRVPMSENSVSRTYDFDYLGSYANSLGILYKKEWGYDEFSFYEYNFPERKLAILNVESLEEIEAIEIGLYDEYRTGHINKNLGVDHYIAMYGTAVDIKGNRIVETSPYIIRNRRGNGNNLLICGDSYNRAIRDVLASHFDTTVYFDYRLLSKIPVDYIIERYKIDVILISSHTSMWGYAKYLFTFMENK